MGRVKGVVVNSNFCCHFLFLLKQLQNKEAEGSSFRESPYNEAPGTPKVSRCARSREHRNFSYL